MASICARIDARESGNNREGVLLAILQTKISVSLSEVHIDVVSLKSKQLRRLYVHGQVYSLV